MNLDSKELFLTYTIQERVKEQLRAIDLLVAQGYTVIDLENRIIDKHSIKDINYDRVPKSAYILNDNKLK